jgi:PAS domain S-box-containing protein
MNTPAPANDSFLTPAKKRIVCWSWMLVILVGYVFIQSLISKEHERDTKQWEIRLGLLAKAQAQNVSAWVRTRFTTLDNLANNVSLKLYMTELAMRQTTAQSTPQDNPTEGEPAQQTYLRNLLVASARSGGFHLTETPSIVHANLAKDMNSGIALLNDKGALIVATSSIPALKDLPSSIQHVNDTAQARTLSQPFRLEDGRTAVALRVPVYGVQAEPNKSNPLGYVVGIAIQDTSFFDLLTSLDQQEPTLESIILAIDKDKQQVVYMSPLPTGIKPLALTVETKNPTAEVLAALSIGHSVQRADYQQHDVLAIAAAIEGTTWALARKIDVDVAMHETTTRAYWLLAAYTLLVGLVSSAMLALWRQATTMQARHTAQHFKDLAFTLDKQEKLLDLIAETTPISTFIVDESDHYHYANRVASIRAGMQRADMLGKSLEAVLGKHRAAPIAQANAQALEEFATYTQLLRRENDHGELEEVIEAQHIPLNDVPVLESEQTIRGVLVIEKDITETTKASEKHTRTLNQLIETLVTIVDKRDPNAANHSAQVARVAEAVAREMRLSERDIRTAKTAGSLMNIGKILVPEAVLTSSHTADSTHREQIRLALQASADLLQHVDFDGPVVETLRQAQEHIDGSGEPNHLIGNAILITARIVGVANDFVAIISPRAWRDGMSIDEALHILLNGIDKEYDRSVVVALVNYLDNAGGRALFKNSTE